MKKLPQIGLPYWIMIISANTIGEAGGDLISMTFGLGYAASTAALIGLFAVAAVIAVLTRTQHASLYWIVIILSSTAGTTMSDLITRNLLGTPEHAAYGAGTLSILISMAIIFGLWRGLAPRTHVSDPLNRVTELLYWAAILASSTLGTAFGDYISNGTPLGFGGGTLVLLAALALVIGMAVWTRISRDLCYWLAIIVTHPLGATMGDYMTKGEGFGLGNLRATLILTGIFLAIVAFRVLSERYQKRAISPVLTPELSQE